MEPTPSRPPPTRRTVPSTPSLKEALSQSASLISPAPYRARPGVQSSERKSGFYRSITALTNAESDLQRKIRQLESERDDYKLAADTANTQLRVQTDAIELASKKDRSKVETLNKDVRFLLDRTEQQEQENQELKNEIKLLKVSMLGSWDFNNLKTTHRDKSRALQRENAALQDRANALETMLESAQISDKPSVALAKFKTLVEEVSSQLATERSQVALLREELSAAQEKLQSVDDLHDEPSPRVKPETDVDFEALLRDQLTLINRLEVVNRTQFVELDRLRRTGGNAELSALEKDSLTARIKLLQRELAERESQDLRMQHLERRQAIWFLQRNGFETIEDVITAYGKVQHNEADLTEKVGENKAEAAGKDYTITHLQNTIDSLSQQISTLHQEISEAKKGSQSFTLYKSTTTREIQMLRDQLQFFDAQSLELRHDQIDERRTAYIKELEDLTTTLKAELVPGDQTNNMQLKRKRTPEADDSTDENKRLKKENASLQIKVDQLEEALGRGEFNADKARVLELADNPARKEFEARTDVLAALRKENSELLLKLSDQGGGIVQIPQQVVLNIKQENRDLQQAVADKDKRMLRLKEIWTAKSMEFREAVYSLLGYRIDFLENGRVRLTSIFADEDDHSFVFTSNDNDAGTLQLTGAGNKEFMDSVRNLMDYWVHDRGNIVLFLAAFQLEAAERQETKERQEGSM